MGAKSVLLFYYFFGRLAFTILLPFFTPVAPSENPPDAPGVGAVGVGVAPNMGGAAGVLAAAGVPATAPKVKLGAPGAPGVAADPNPNWGAVEVLPAAGVPKVKAGAAGGVGIGWPKPPNVGAGVAVPGTPLVLVISVSIPELSGVGAVAPAPKGVAGAGVLAPKPNPPVVAPPPALAPKPGVEPEAPKAGAAGVAGLDVPKVKAAPVPPAAGADGAPDEPKVKAGVAGVV
mmetsp:Transcript_25420/g.32974  ORF Transcript_25420/g.32974 Transcript_25420/m.32974 type:complete len:231 (+) Transcript_25420:395-1087(+)